MKFRKHIVVISLIVLSIYLAGCSEDSPVITDGTGQIEITALGNFSLDGNDSVYTPMQNAEAYITSEYGTEVRRTDENGILRLTNLPFGTYSVNIKMIHPENANIIITGSVNNINVNSNETKTALIHAEQISGTGLCISELYVSGPVNNFYFFYDQFTELYNYSSEVKYLDGMQIFRVSGNSSGKGAGADEGDDGDIDGVTFAFKFPGNPGEKNYPIEPHSFKVIALIATNHKSSVSSSIDLSSADWEFYNQYSASDFDNPNVPNLSNLIPEKDVDFLLALKDDVVVLASGEDANFQDGIDISTIIDGIQYRSDVTFPETLDKKIDKASLISPLKYSGKSMRRREPGMDTNNGIVDWEIISAPTPGYF